VLLLHHYSAATFSCCSFLPYPRLPQSLFAIADPCLTSTCMPCQHVKDYHPHSLAPYPSRCDHVPMVPADLYLITSQSGHFFTYSFYKRYATLLPLQLFLPIFPPPLVQTRGQFSTSILLLILVRSPAARTGERKFH
jgi:hypothetical protein